MLRGKIHRATITQCDVDYVGSITIDADLLRATDIRPNELVAIYDIDNGARFETYVIRGESGSGIIGVNGAAAKLVEPGHKLIIACFGLLTEDQLDDHEARIVIVDDQNAIAQRRRYASTLEPDAPALV
ncbi:MAG: aspartate 1-decarboxylase [Phycisphaeraceae bacterium]|nr:aspartate 1-decarboxylase [Phycisphaeraceae bacterium]